MDISDVKLLPLIRILALVGQGFSETKACSQVGISFETYKKRMEENPNVLAEFLAEEKAKFSAQRDEIINARALILQKMIDKARETDNPSVLIGIDSYLSKMELETGKILGLVQSDEEENPLLPPGTPIPVSDARAYLDQIKPQLRRAANKATVTETTRTIELDFGEDNETVDADP